MRNVTGGKDASPLSKYGSQKGGKTNLMNDTLMTTMQGSTSHKAPPVEEDLNGEDGTKSHNSFDEKYLGKLNESVRIIQPDSLRANHDIFDARLKQA